MAEEEKDVKKEESTPTPVQEPKEETPEVSEDVKPPEETVDKTVYEKVRDAMRKEREEKKAIKSQNDELIQRIEDLETKQDAEDIPEDAPQRDPRVDIVYLMNKDKFVKDNLDLIEQKMSDNPALDVNAAALSVKAELFDRIQKETEAAPDNKPLKQEKPTATGEAQPKKELPDDPKKVFDRALKGEVDIDPGQLEAIKRHMSRQE